MEMTKFEALGLDEKILRAITDMGFEETTPIQAKAIPVQMKGADIIGQAQTGTGKTAAFGIPMLQKLDSRNKKLQAGFSPAHATISLCSCLLFPAPDPPK